MTILIKEPKERSRWLNWKPEREISGVTLEAEPTEPTKPEGSVGSVGPIQEVKPNIVSPSNENDVSPVQALVTKSPKTTDQSVSAAGTPAMKDEMPAWRRKFIRRLEEIKRQYDAEDPSKSKAFDQLDLVKEQQAPTDS